jgi:hypothetical protein
VFPPGLTLAAPLSGRCPKNSEWEVGFDLTEADDEYAEVHPYADPRY